MKRIFLLTVLIVSTAAFAIERRTVYLALITGSLCALLLWFLNVGRLLTTRTPVRTAAKAEMSIERV